MNTNPQPTLSRTSHTTLDEFVNAIKSAESPRVHSYLVSLGELKGTNPHRTEDKTYLGQFGFNVEDLVKSVKDTTIAILSSIGSDEHLHYLIQVGNDEAIPQYCSSAFYSPDDTTIEKIPVVNGIVYNEGSNRFSIFRSNYNYAYPISEDVNRSITAIKSSADAAVMGGLIITAFLHFAPRRKLEQSYEQWQNAVHSLDNAHIKHALPEMKGNTLHLGVISDGFDIYSAILDLGYQIRAK